MTTYSFSNRLIQEKSPYLLQHAHNPVDWFPWGEEAFQKAKNEDKLVLVSIGYATCHWCHVMEKESFEDAHLAEYLNAHFVAIKVDREERPDVDKIYMDALHALGQQGGWPLNMFVTPDGKPVTGGTYFPPQAMYGRVSFRNLLENMHGFWKNDRDKINSTANEITLHLQQKSSPTDSKNSHLTWDIIEKTVAMFGESFDSNNGGFNQQLQNKFPPSMGLMLLLRHYHRTGETSSLEMVEKTLQKMFAGGIYDQLGGGLSRYSTDFEWLVPHFEKMLYDNSLFVWALIETFQVTKNKIYEKAARDVLHYIERDMMSDDGAFFSAEDADSEGVEGKFYVWSKSEVFDLLGKEQAELACLYWGISEKGNFEGKNILNRSFNDHQIADQIQLTEDELECKINEIREKMLTHRSQRIRPLRDDKVLTSWNALMISAFARAARVFEEEHFEKIAINAAEFIQQNLRDDSGRLHRRWREGEMRYAAYLNDYAQMALACLDLFDCTYDEVWFLQAKQFVDEINLLFRNEEGSYFDTGSDGEKLLTRNSDGYDGVEPSGNSTLAMVLLKLHAYGLDQDYYEDAQRIFRSFSPYLEQAGVSFSAMLSAFYFSQTTTKEVVVIGKKTDDITLQIMAELRLEFHPDSIIFFGEDELEKRQESCIPLLQGRKMIHAKTTVYVCHNQTCNLPIHSLETLKEQLH